MEVDRPPSTTPPPAPDPSHPPALVSFLPAAPASTNLKQRADLLTLKSRLAALLPPDDGLEYWNALGGFVSGKINRQELGEVMKRVLGSKGEAVQLHNALLLSILYNTTRISLPPAAVRHAGWHKRPRDKDGLTLEDRDPKRRKLKLAVMDIGKRERAELKTMGLGGIKAELESREITGESSVRASLDSRGPKLGADGLPLTLTGEEKTALQEEYLRTMQAPSCCESKLLPDVGTLQDRMKRVAFECGLTGGVDARVAALGVQAIESHLRGMISGVISLIRSDRSATTSKPPSPTQNGTASNGDHPEITLTNGHTTVPLPSHPSNSTSEPKALSLKDFASLFEISPHLLVHAHVGAVDRLYAFGPSDDSEFDSSSSASSSDDEEEATLPVPLNPGEEALAPNKVGRKTSLRAPSNGTGSGGSTAPRTLRRTLSRSMSVSNPNATGRDKYVIDPSMVVVPQGHPDVVPHHHSSLTSASSASRPGMGQSSAGAMTAQGQGISTRHGTVSAPPTLTSRSTIAGGSPKNSVSLRNQLFPELDGPGAALPAGGGEGQIVASPTAVPHLRSMSPSVETTTDAASDSDDGTGKKGKHAVGGVKKAGRKLWEVVDSVALLDGVLQ